MRLRGDRASIYSLYVGWVTKFLIQLSWLQEAAVFRTMNLLTMALLVVLAAGCAVVQKAEQPKGPYEIAILAVTDTRGELEPCG